MTEKQLFIPEKLKVGYVERKDCYNGILAYVIYFDQKGIIRKEKSWESWRDKKIEPQEFENIPTEGFVFNKKAGGGRSYSSWDSRQTYMRVWDPRGFEIEISIPNLEMILAECNCSKGKGIEGKLVYSWSGTDLVLLPVDSNHYKTCVNYTSLQSCGVKAKELILGASYLTKKQVPVIYIGRFDHHEIINSYRDSGSSLSVRKKYVFWDPKNQSFDYLNDLKSIASLNSDTVTPDYAELVDSYIHSKFGSKVVSLVTKPAIGLDRTSKIRWSRYWFIEKTPGEFYSMQDQHGYYYSEDNPITPIDAGMKVVMTPEGIRFFKAEPETVPSELKPRYSWDYNRHTAKTYPIEDLRSLYAVLESGSLFQIQGYNLGDKYIGDEQE